MASEKSDKPLKADKKSKKGDKASKGAGKPGGKAKSKKAKKKRTNPVFLLIAIGCGFAGLIGVGSLLVWYASRTGKVEEMLAVVPGECNAVRGINVSQLSKFPGYKAEVEKFYTEPVKSATAELAKAGNQDAETFVDYMVIAKTKNPNGSVGTMYVFRTAKKIDPNGLPAAVPGAAPQTVGGLSAFKMPAKAPGVLAGSVVYCPSDRHVVLIPAGPQQSSMASAAAAAKGAPQDSFAGKLDTTGRLVIRGSIWLLVKAQGGNKDYISSMTGLVNNDFKAISDAGKKSQTFGVWTTPGGTGVRVGVAMQVGDEKEAKDIVKGIKGGAMGKADESEAPNQLKSAAGTVTSNRKLFGEFMQYIEYNNKKETIYFVTTVSGENATQMMSMINNPAMGTGDSDPAGGGGAPAGGGGQGPKQPGLPGGIATPGMGP